jgi:transaldolase/glucose-6-phosphate isomerase
MTDNRLQRLHDAGQSIWLDFIDRPMLRNGELARRIRDDALTGMTSNPTIFEKALAEGTAYDDQIRSASGEFTAMELFELVETTDVRDACDIFRPTYDAANGADGFVSIEVSPGAANDATATIAEAQRLWGTVDRPNVMVKVPGTVEGAKAVRALTAAGINVNITLLFAIEAHARVIDAYMTGLEDRVAAGKALDHVHSVASFFVSRVDTEVDKRLDAAAKANGANEQTFKTLHGKAAIANAKLAYRLFQQQTASPRWKALVARGATVQRPLWASTSTKNPAYRDVMYVETLIGPDTVNTMPPETMDAFRDHGTAKLTIEDDVEGAKKVLSDLDAVEISLDKITDELVVEGVASFAEAADKFYAALAAKREKILDGNLLRMNAELGGPAKDVVDAEIKKQSHIGAPRKLWSHDKSYWTNADEDKWLGWLDIVQRELGDLSQLENFAKTVQAEKITDVVLLGMGGSSLGSDVLSEVFGERPGWPKVYVLDSTDPDRIATVANAITLASAMFIVASKSGSTLEPNILKDYFFDRVTKAGGHAGKHFVAITDPGSSMEKTAKQQDFAHIFYGDPPIGGRFSVLSKFGLVPAAAMGLDIKRLLTDTQKIVVSCGEYAPPDANPGVKLGAMLGALARDCGRDKITIVASKALSSVGTWMEQLIAESTGKHGKGLIPIDREPLGNPKNYGNDRVFLHVHLAGSEDRPGALKALAEAGHPVISLSIEDSYQIGQLFYVCEVAIAIVGSVIGINPFDQPDVEAAKIGARDLTQKFEDTGKLNTGSPILEDEGIALYADDTSREALKDAKTLNDALRAHFKRIGADDYAAFLAFLEQTDGHDARLQSIRLKLRDRKACATCVEYGPRYLHSTGQDYKGGPNSGVFVVITAEHKQDLAIPGRKASFGTVQLAQAIGDFSVLNQRARRVVRIHLKDIDSGLKRLSEAVDAALQ